ncbi:rhomboid family intramembrane serine protease [Thalassovita sp.]|jgi:membrane associated rhomboid family serine protease|uniref:rhomboid family intramembrane serine protease n=1 Tax=Thalassovita sp. TaxID=1979401 RepID=UPI003B591697
MSSPNNSPFHTVPPVVVALSLVLIGIEIVFALGASGIIGGPEAIGWRLESLQTYAFSAPIFQWMLENGQFPAEHMLRFVSYAFVHGSFTGALFAVVILLAMGNMVGRVFSQFSMLLVFLLGTICGALAYGLIVDSQVALMGAFPGVYALIGAYSFILWVHAGLTGASQLQAFRLIGILMGLQLFFGAVFDGPPDWIADGTGFVVGFAASFVLSPGGWQRLREKLRHR